MLIEKLADGRMVMDKAGVQAYLINYISDAALRATGAHPVFTVFAVMDDGALESVIGTLIRRLFDTEPSTIFGAPTQAVYDLYWELFEVKMTAVGGYYYFDHSLDLA